MAFLWNVQLYPPNGYLVTRARYAWSRGFLAGVLRGEALVDDNHALVLKER